MRLPVACAALAAAFAASTLVQAQPQGETFQVIRATDRQLSCEQLMAEYNELAAAKAQSAQQQQAKKASRGILGGLARGVLAGAANSGYWGTGNHVAANAIWYGGHAAADAAGNAITASGETDPATAGLPLGEQRMKRLETLISEKGC